MRKAILRGTRQRNSIRAITRCQDGAVAAMFALMIPVLAGVVALSVDLGRMFNLDTELQHAADAAALAAASQLDGNVGARARATAAAIAGAGNSCAGTTGLACNSQTFATDGVGSNVSIAAGDIRFLVDLTTRAIATSDADAAFAEVTAAPRTVNYGFAGIVGAATSAAPTARAVAGMGTAYCRVPPLMICNPFETMAESFLSTLRAEPPNENLEGIGIILKAGGQNSPWAPGNFGLLSLDNQNISTNDSRDAMGRVNPLAECFGESVGSKPGQATAVAQGLNVRFDIYEGPIQGLATDAQYRPAMNTVKGLIKTGDSCSFNPNGGNGWTKPANPYDGPSNPDGVDADAMGFPRDKCAYAPPGGDGSCIPTNGGRIGDGDWDSTHYMRVNHNDAPLPMDVTTRYGVYQWELGIGGLSVAEDASPQCGVQSSPEDTIPDRRVISVAVINCIAEGVVGQTPDLGVIAYLDLFLTEPMGVFDGNNDLYGEVVGETSGGGEVDAIARNTVVIFE